MPELGAMPQEMLDEVMVQEHTSCQCECTVQPADCSAHHIYSKLNVLNYYFHRVENKLIFQDRLIVKYL